MLRFSYPDFLQVQVQVNSFVFHWITCFQILLLSYYLFLRLYFKHYPLGNIAAFRNYIATATFSSERTKYLSIAAGFQTLGMTIGPGLQACLSPLQCSEPSMDSYISLDMFTTAG